jgi:protein-tyrosine phosphatase
VENPAHVTQTLRTLSNPANHPVLVHCTQGKDRTGIIVLLTLLILGVPLDAIKYDYLLSENGLILEREFRLAEIRSMGLSDDFAECPQNWVDKMANRLKSAYGGIGGYVRWIGLREADEEAMIDALGTVKT